MHDRFRLSLLDVNPWISYQLCIMTLSEAPFVDKEQYWRSGLANEVIPSHNI